MSSFVSYFRFLQNPSQLKNETKNLPPETCYLSPFPFLLAPSCVETDGHTLHPTGGLSPAPPGLSHSDLRPLNLRLCSPGPGRPAAIDVLYPHPGQLWFLHIFKARLCLPLFSTISSSLSPPPPRKPQNFCQDHNVPESFSLPSIISHGIKQIWLCPSPA